MHYEKHYMIIRSHYQIRIPIFLTYMCKALNFCYDVYLLNTHFILWLFMTRYNIYSNDILTRLLTENEYAAYVWTPLIRYAFMEKDIRISRYVLPDTFFVAPIQ